MSCSTERKKKQNELNKKQHKILQDVLAGILLRGGFWSPTIIFWLSNGMLLERFKQLNNQNCQFDPRWFRSQTEELFVNKLNKKEEFARETISLCDSFSGF